MALRLAVSLFVTISAAEGVRVVKKLSSGLSNGQVVGALEQPGPEAETDLAVADDSEAEDYQMERPSIFEISTCGGECCQPGKYVWYRWQCCSSRVTSEVFGDAPYRFRECTN